MKISHLILATLMLVVPGWAGAVEIPAFVDSVLRMPAPTFPDRSVSIAKCGAKEGRLSTSAIQKAIDQISAQGGGTVIVPAGNWLSGRLTLKPNVNLHIAEGATLNFSGERKDYLPDVASRYEGTDVLSAGAMIYANGAENIAVTGGGVLKAPSRECEMALEKHNLPTFIGPVNCRGVLIEGVTLEGSIFWNIAPVYCSDIIIRGVRVSSYGHTRTDGIDIDSSRNVLIEDTELDCGDDCFTLKAGRGEDGVAKGIPTENVVIRNCRVKRGVGGVTIGTETAGFVRNVYACGVVMENARMPLYFKTRRPRGGGAENIWIRDIKVINTPGAAIQMDMLGNPAWVGELAARLPARPVGPLTPRFSDIHIDGIEIDSCAMFIKAKGLPETPVENMTVTNVRSANKNIMLQDIGAIEITFAD